MGGRAGFAAIAVAMTPEVLTYLSTNLLSSSLGLVFFPLPSFCIAFGLFFTAQPFLKLAWHDRRIEVVSLAAGSAYALFSASVGNPITRPSHADLGLIPQTMARTGFTAVLTAYGPYSYWHILEVWSPQTGFFVAISVGTGLLLIMLSVLMTYSVTLVALNLENVGSVRRSYTGQVLGSMATTLFSNACGCCTSFLLPAVAGIFGVSAASPLFQVANGAPPVFDFLTKVNLALLVTGVMLSTKRLRSCSVIG